MPVPSVTITSGDSPCAAPNRHSAQAAALASLSTEIGTGTRRWRLCLQRLVAPRQVRGEDDGGPVAATKPAAPMPTATTTSCRRRGVGDDLDDGVLDDAAGSWTVRGVAAGPGEDRAVLVDEPGGDLGAADVDADRERRSGSSDADPLAPRGRRRR